jgi:hypothetical protein
MLTARGVLMIWQLRIQYANGTERVLKSFKNRETALKWVDRIYKDGYPLHFAYVVRSVPIASAAVPAAAIPVSVG